MLSNCKPINLPKKYTSFHLLDLTDNINLPIEEWPGNCSVLAHALADYMEYGPDRVVRGHYTGPVEESGFWGDRKGHPFIQHSWVRSPEGLVLDPTFYSFTDKAPSLYVGHGYHHDSGGNIWRLSKMGPPPFFRKSEANNIIGKSELEPGPLHKLNETLGHTGPKRTIAQLRYVANTSLLMLEPYAKEIFGALAEVEGFAHNAWIPQSNYDIVFNLSN